VEELPRLEGHSISVRSVAFHAQGNLLASGSSDRTIRLWDIETGEELSRLEGDQGIVSSVAFHPQGNLLASGSFDGTIRLWDIETGEEFSRLEGHSNSVNSVAFHPQRNILASCSFSDKKTLQLNNLELMFEYVEKRYESSLFQSLVEFSEKRFEKSVVSTELKRKHGEVNLFTDDDSKVPFYRISKPDSVNALNWLLSQDKK